MRVCAAWYTCTCTVEWSASHSGTLGYCRHRCQSVTEIRIVMSSVDLITFSTKIVNFRGSRKRIVLQNQNGPCPLLALVNGLILRDRLQLPSGASEVDSSRLQHQLVGHIVDSQTNMTANLQHQIAETIDLVMRGRFIEGMDVNPQFNSCSGFEYTQEVR